MRHRFYIAAPFFNGPQLCLVQMIERRLQKFKLPYFSPRESSESAKLRQAKAENLSQEKCHSLALEIFRKNTEEIDRCSMLLAVLDWILPANQDLVLVEHPVHNNVNNIKTVHIPDTGTVFEMGYAYAKGIPIIGVQGQKTKTNLMLSRACFAFCDLETLTSFLAPMAGYQGEEL